VCWRDYWRNIAISPVTRITGEIACFRQLCYLAVSMLIVQRYIPWVFLVFFCVGAIPAQQAAKKAPHRSSAFVLDSSKPFVYVEFLRVGKREPLREGEISEGVWLRIVNNCHVPIQFMASGGNGNEAIPNEEVIYDEYHGVVGTMPDGSQSPPPQKPRSEMPSGYMFDVGSNYILLPGKNLSFSVPANHVAEDWHIEIPFDFVLPSTTCCQPKMTALFFLVNVPDGYKAKFQQHKTGE
jgi:hypothetical protein